MGAGARPCTNHRYSYIKKADHDAKGAILPHITMVLNDCIMFHKNDDKSCKSYIIIKPVSINKVSISKSNN